MEGFLARIPAQLTGYVPHLVAIMALLMGLAAIVSFNNQGLKDAIKAHVVWVVIGLALVGAGGAFLMGFRV